MLKYRNAELVLGALFATAVWAGIWGWYDSYAFTEKQKDECYETAKKTGQKSDECKTFWEKTTSDPIAFFTLVLAVSTVGLWVATIFLYRAGEKQFYVAKISAEASRSAAETARLSIEADRAWITWDTYTFGPIINSVWDGNVIRNGYGIVVMWKNTGRSLALRVSSVNKKVLIGPGDAIPTFVVNENDLATEPSSRGVGAQIGGFLVPMDDIEADDFRNRRRRVIFYSKVTYTDIFHTNIIRISEACFEIIFAGGTITYNGGRPSPVSMRLVGPQNSSS